MGTGAGVTSPGAAAAHPQLSDWLPWEGALRGKPKSNHKLRPCPLGNRWTDTGLYTPNTTMGHWAFHIGPHLQLPEFVETNPALFPSPLALCAGCCWLKWSRGDVLLCECDSSQGQRHPDVSREPGLPKLPLEKGRTEQPKQAAYPGKKQLQSSKQRSITTKLQTSSCHCLSGANLTMSNWGIGWVPIRLNWVMV